MKNIILKLFVALFLIAWAIMSQAAVLCLKSAGKDRAIFFQMLIPNDYKTMGTVKYKDRENEIKIRLKNEVIRNKELDSRPAVVVSTWIELGDNTAGGRYIITTQGAILGDVVYVNNHGRRFRFFDDQDSYFDGGCTWNVRRRG